MRFAVVIPVVLSLFGCTMTTERPWSPSFEPPLALDTARVHLEPLGTRHAALDFAALMGSRASLQRTLRWGDWPRDDFTVEENSADLARHWGECVAREAYAYTVLSPDRSACVGCVYVEPVQGAPPGESRAALAYWTVDRGVEEGLDLHLLEALGGWLQTQWPFDIVQLPILREHQQGLDVARRAGWEISDADSTDSHHVYVWRRP
ncbi:MAG: hypothetical protein ACI9EF_003761 [Pseudohongiellaceae bacterium]